MWKKTIKLSIVFLTVLLLCSIRVKTMNFKVCAESKTIQKQEFVQMLSELISLKKNRKDLTKDKAARIIIQQGNISGLDKPLTNEDAAVLANKMDELLYGKAKYNHEIYDNIKKLSRISDKKLIEKTKKADVYQIFAKGIMTGKSNGVYSQSRRFEPKLKITNKEAREIIQRLKNKKARKKLSPDGQVIRTEHLPEHSKRYPYILESFPNSFYDMKMRYDYDSWDYQSKLIKKQEFLNYINPVNITKEKWLDYDGNARYGIDTEEKMKTAIKNYMPYWVKTINQNLTMRSKADYRKINETWVQDLAETYWKSQGAQNAKPYIDSIKEYAQFIKKYQVVLQCRRVVMEPSTMYQTDGFDYIRCVVTFRLASCNNKQYLEQQIRQPDLKENIIYSKFHDSKIQNFETGKWVTVITDVPITLGVYNGKDVSVAHTHFYLK